MERTRPPLTLELDLGNQRLPVLPVLGNTGLTLRPALGATFQHRARRRVVFDVVWTENGPEPRYGLCPHLSGLWPLRGRSTLRSVPLTSLGGEGPACITPLPACRARLSPVSVLTLRSGAQSRFPRPCPPDAPEVPKQQHHTCKLMDTRPGTSLPVDHAVCTSASPGRAKWRRPLQRLLNFHLWTSESVFARSSHLYSERKCSYLARLCL